MKVLFALFSFLWIFLDVGGVWISLKTCPMYVGLIGIGLGAVTAFISAVFGRKMTTLAIVGAVASIVLFVVYLYMHLTA